MKSSVFWDITPYSPLKIKRHFEGICRLHLQGLRVSQARNQHETGIIRLILIFLHDVISKKRELFIIIDVRTSNPAQIMFEKRTMGRIVGSKRRK
jgi:hypothetical protein